MKGVEAISWHKVEQKKDYMIRFNNTAAKTADNAKIVR